MPNLKTARIAQSKWGGGYQTVVTREIPFRTVKMTAGLEACLI